MNPNNDALIAEFYRLGFSMEQVGDLVGVNEKTVKRRLDAQGVEIRPGNNVTRSKWLTEKTTQGG